MNNAEVTTPKDFEAQPDGPPKRKRRNSKPPSHKVGPSRRTRDFRWPGEDDVAIASRFSDWIGRNPPPAGASIHQIITHRIALFDSVEAGWRQFFKALVLLVLDIATSERLIEREESDRYLGKVLPTLENTTIQWWRSSVRQNFRATADMKSTTGNCAYAIFLLSRYCPLGRCRFY